jgi:hypothetical protein
LNIVAKSPFLLAPPLPLEDASPLFILSLSSL